MCRVFWKQYRFANSTSIFNHSFYYIQFTKYDKSHTLLWITNSKTKLYINCTLTENIQWRAYIFLSYSPRGKKYARAENFISSSSKPLARPRLRAVIIITSAIITFPAWYLHHVVTGCYEWTVIIRKCSHGD